MRNYLNEKQETDFAFRIHNPNRGTGYWPMKVEEWDGFAKKLTSEMRSISKEIKKAKAAQNKAWDEMQGRKKKAEIK